MVVLLLLNMLVMPLITQHQVEEVDYGTFIKMTENKEIGQVEIEDNQILFTNKDKSKIYKTGLLNDDGLYSAFTIPARSFPARLWSRCPR